jgi:hypothetical protein
MAGDPAQGAVILGLARGLTPAAKVVIFDTEGPAVLGSHTPGDAGIDALAVGAVNNSQQPGTTDLVIVNQNPLTVEGNHIASSVHRSQRGQLRDRPRSRLRGGGRQP